MKNEVIKASKLAKLIQLRSYERTFHQMILRDSSFRTKEYNKNIGLRLEKFCGVV